MIRILREKIMPRLAYTDDIDLCFGNAVRELKNLVASPLACNLRASASISSDKIGSE